MEKKSGSGAGPECRPREILDRLPGKVFDFHAHLWRMNFLPERVPAIFAHGPDEVSADFWRKRLGRSVGADRLSGALFMPTVRVRKELIEEANTSVLDAAEKDGASRALALVTPDMTARQFNACLDRQVFAGFKPYHTRAARKNTFEATPDEFIPEWVWQTADRHNLFITLHLVRSGAMADEKNIRYLREHCEKFPGARVNLAHAGRSFHGPNARQGAEKLAGTENIWFDLSAVCEPEPLEALLEFFGPRRLLWGSDFPVAETRGRCVTIGDGFLWVTDESTREDRTGPDYHAWPVVMESLRAFLQAADNFGLDEQDRQDIFFGNACRLLGLAGDDDRPGRGEELYRHARRRIPGGTHLLSKRPEMFAPGQWPAYFSEARGCRVKDLDGREYLDFSIHGIGACLLGFRDPDVTRAVRRRISLGSYCTLNPPEEVFLADRLCEIHPWAEQARFTRSGGEAMAVAARIARATTDRSAVAVCGYHGWHDWYLAANLGRDDSLRGHLLPGLKPLGVPGELRGTCDTFTYNNRREFDEVMEKHGRRLAAVIMEPCRGRDPEPGFLEHIRQKTRETGALLVFDEITIGWRLCFGGAHLLHGVEPDMAVFAKALGNGHPIAAVIGTESAMEGAQESFISSTYWTEGVGPVAALATLEKMSRLDVPSYCRDAGLAVSGAWRESARKHGVPVEIPAGFPALSRFAFQHEESDVLKTIFTGLMLERGFLAGTAFYASMAHAGEMIERYAGAVDDVFALLGTALEKNNVHTLPRGPVAQSGFRRLIS